ncbi:DUF983 domain-containing protein [Kordiimonas aquimaris]|uniref:DUF983 domain-containing protein n=1 Tax=Kordiimonas aquimaris TaxID=707591 RepID=UPI0021CF8F1B|nr:DUF983 domain-containing protein [Kordiimonas aquimaris]
MSDTLNTKHETDRHSRSVSPYRAGFRCVCPNCGEAPLFHNVLEVREICPHCDFDLSAADPGDGAQVFVILILGFVCALLGFILYGTFSMPPWMIAAVLGMVILFGSIWMLRVFKATLVALQFHHDAHEGKLDDKGA